MDNKQFDILRKKAARQKSMFNLQTKIVDYEFKLIEYQHSTDILKEELKTCKEQLALLESVNDEE